MDTKSSLLRGICICLVLAVLFPTGPMWPVTALGSRQEPPPGQVAQGYGNFPRLPIVAPNAAGTTLALYLVEGDTATLFRPVPVLDERVKTLCPVHRILEGSALHKLGQEG